MTGSRSDENNQAVARWFFECFEETVGRRHVHTVRIVNDVNLVASNERPVDNVVLHFADLRDLDLFTIWCDVKHVGMDGFFDLFASPALTAGIRAVFYRLFAIDGLREHLGREQFADTVIPEKQIGMGELFLSEDRFQYLLRPIMTDDGVKWHV
jgi:hypothetical protein